MSIPKNSCLILGGTGAVGKSLVKDVLANNAFTRVLTLGRRPLPTEGDSSFKNLSLLEQQTVDLENPGSTFPSDLPQIVFCTLGTTRAAAGSAEAFKRIDQGYVLDAARHIHEKAPKDPVTGLAKVHFLYCSSAGSSHKSYLLYSKTKGETENALADIGFERVSIFQPGFLKVVEPRSSGNRMAEMVIDKVMPVLDYFAERSVSAGVDKVAETMRLVSMSDSVEVEGVKPKRVETHNKSTVAFYSNADIHDIVNHHASSKL
ncbi:hypothetical protein BGW38_010826 [Lunasporangiospora selenospora]|uniref:NAD(P)-binding domain-containing protein n=1 Tax=Lunasporangiospora selenospora TaxID=979761 RepID=A0A9P6FXY7_9FUNG|nr:hypothetical protein BGW38_010826 [Lunasporangiospora selenospora]